MKTKQETIKRLTELMATVQMAYYKGKFGERNGDDTGGDGAVCGDLWIHETREAGISIDLYHFESDGKLVCDGLTFQRECDKEPLRASCVSYNPDWENEQLWVQCCDAEDGVSYGLDLLPEELPDGVLSAITQWLENAMVPAERVLDKAVSEAKGIIALWSDWCMGYDDEDLWLDYMVKHPKGHCNRQHLQEKWDYCYEKYGNKAAMHMFWRELDDDNCTILTEYITTQWHKTN